MKRKINILFFLFACRLLAAQLPHIVPPPPAIAKTSVSDTRSWTAFNNPAMLGYAESASLGLVFENRFLLKELSTKSVQAAFAAKAVNIGASFSHFGYSLYHEMLAGIDFARNFSGRFALGAGFDYYAAWFSADNAYRGALLGRIGISARISPAFTLAFSAFNPFQNNIQARYVLKRLPSVFSIGTEYFFSSDFIWRTQIDKEISSSYRFAAGFEYCMLQIVTVKLGGYAFNHFVPCLGFDFLIKDYAASLNCELNPLLGLNTMIMLRYKFKDKR